MPQGDLRIESNTLHDDFYLSYHKIFESNSSNTLRNYVLIKH
jgi:hypothetical protein